MVVAWDVDRKDSDRCTTRSHLDCYGLEVYLSPTLVYNGDKHGLFNIQHINYVYAGASKMRSMWDEIYRLFPFFVIKIHLHWVSNHSEYCLKCCPILKRYRFADNL